MKECAALYPGLPSMLGGRPVEMAAVGARAGELEVGARGELLS